MKFGAAIPDSAEDARQRKVFASCEAYDHVAEHYPTDEEAGEALRKLGEIFGPRSR